MPPANRSGSREGAWELAAYGGPGVGPARGVRSSVARRAVNWATPSALRWVTVAKKRSGRVPGIPWDADATEEASAESAPESVGRIRTDPNQADQPSRTA